MVSFSGAMVGPEEFHLGSVSEEGRSEEASTVCGSAPGLLEGRGSKIGEDGLGLSSLLGSKSSNMVAEPGLQQGTRESQAMGKGNAGSKNSTYDGKGLHQD